MITMEEADGIVRILMGEYPAERYNLDIDGGKAFGKSLIKRFGNTPYTVDDIFDILDKIMDASPNHIPSVAMIFNAVKRSKNHIPDYQALPPPPINEKGVKMAKNLLQRFKDWQKADSLKRTQGPKPGERQSWHWPPSVTEREKNEICRFARWNFPDLTDEQIARDFDVFREQYRMGAHNIQSKKSLMDGYEVILRIDKYIGQINQWVIYPYHKKEWGVYHQKPGQK